MKVIKRNGSEVNFDVNKIVAAIAKANKAAHREELTREQIQEIAGIPIDHSFLKCKKELTDYGYQVGKISMKERTVIFKRT